MKPLTTQVLTLCLMKDPSTFSERILYANTNKTVWTVLQIEDIACASKEIHIAPISFQGAMELKQTSSVGHYYFATKHEAKSFASWLKKGAKDWHVRIIV